MISSIHRLAGAALLLTLCTAPTGQAAVDSLDLEAAWTHRDNIGLAPSRADERGDSVITLGGSRQFRWQTSESTAMQLRGGAQYNSYEVYSDIDNLQLDLGALIEFQPERRFSAPWYTLSGRLTLADYESDIRDGSIFELRAGAAKRFTDRLTARAFLGFNSRSADDAFRTRYNEFVTRLDYLLRESVTLYGGVGAGSGDIVATAPPSAGLFSAADAFEPDDAVGGGQFAYRLDAETARANIGVNWVISRANALDFAFQRYTADSPGENDYDQSIFWLAWLYRD